MWIERIFHAPPGSMPYNRKRMMAYCCERMKYDLSQECEAHASRYDCPDALVALVGGRYGLIVHDGGSSVIEIAFCPWCGSRLTLSEADVGADVGHPYAAYESDPLWGVIQAAINDLKMNNDLELTTAKEYVIGYICRAVRGIRS